MAGDGEIGRAYVRITPNSSGFQSSLERQTAGVGKSVGSAIGKAIGVGIGATVAAAGVGLAMATKLAVGFDRSMRNVNSIAQLSEQSFQALNKQVLDLAAASGTGPTDIANGLYDVVSSGFDAADAMKILTASTKGARAGLTTVATSTKVVTAVLNAYHLKAGDAKKVTDQLFQTVNVGVLSFEELASSIGDVLPFASTLGVGMNQVGGALATMTKEGINASEATTRIKAVMTQFLSPSKELAQRFTDLGFASGEAMIRSLGFQGALDKLAASTHGNHTEMAKLFPDVRAMGGALALTGKNSAGAKKDLEALNKSVGATGRAFNEQAKSVSQQWQTLVARMQVVGIKIGVRVFPLINFGLKEATKFISFVDKEIQKVSGPQLNGKPLSFKAQAKIVWTDVQPSLDAAAAELWKQVKAGSAAAFQKVTGAETVDVSLTPGIKMPVGGQTVIPVQPVIKVEDQNSAGVLHTWWDHNVQPVIDDLGKTGSKKGGESFAASFSKSLSSETQKMSKGLADMFVTGPLQVLDGALKGDAGRIGKGFMTTLAGGFRGSGLGVVKDALMSVIGNDVKNALSTAGSLAVAGSVNIGHHIASGISSGLSFLSKLPGQLWGKISSAVSSVASHDVSGTFKKMGTGIITGITGGLASLASSVGGVLSRGLDTASNISVSGLFTSIGSDIISGIVSGIAGSVGGLFSAVINAAVGAKNAAVKAIKSGSPSRLFADEVGEPIGDGIALGINKSAPRIKKAITGVLNSAARQSLGDAKQNMNQLAGGLGDMVGQIIDAQVKKATAPLQAKLTASQKSGQAGDLARQRADLQKQLSGGKTEGESDSAFIQRMADVRQQIADMDRAAREQALQDSIDNIQTEGDKRKEAVSRGIADLSAEFNAGKITGKQFTDGLTKILKANGADVKSAGDLLGFAFAQAFSAQLKGVTSQISAIAAVIGLNGGGAGGAGFDVSVTNPLDVVRSQLKDAKASLKQDQKDLRDAHKTKDKKDDERAKRAETHDRLLIRALEAILRAASHQPASGTINVNMKAGAPSIDELLAAIVGDAAR